MAFMEAFTEVSLIILTTLITRLTMDTVMVDIMVAEVTTVAEAITANRFILLLITDIGVLTQVELPSLKIVGMDRKTGVEMMEHRNREPMFHVVVLVQLLVTGQKMH